MEFESEGYYGAQALPIGNHTEGVEPQDGLEYLSLVHCEAKTIPDVMTVDRSQFVECSENADTTATREVQQLPTKLVQREMKKFSELRQYCRRMLDLYPTKCLSDTPVEFSTPSKKLFDQEPSLTVILSLSQVAIFELLEYIEEVCLSDDEASRVPSAVTAWVWSLFCVVDKPVPMDYMAIIRGIGRRCGTLSTPLSHHSETQFLVLFVLVCHFFQQMDLLQEFTL